jgi:hypothetical protein
MNILAHITNNRKKIVSGIIILGVAIVFLGIGYSVKGVLASNKEGDTKKMILLNENLEINNTLYVPLSSKAHCEQLGHLYALTDRKQQVFEIKGQSPDHFVCLIKDGKQWIYQAQKNNPLTLKSFNPTKITVSDYDFIGDANIHITNVETVKKITAYMTDENVVDTPAVVTVAKNLLFTSPSYPGLVLEMGYENYGEDCYITDHNQGITWKIGHELISYIMLSGG